MKGNFISFELKTSLFCKLFMAEEIRSSLSIETIFYAQLDFFKAIIKSQKLLRDLKHMKKFIQTNHHKIHKFMEKSLRTFPWRFTIKKGGKN